MMRWDEMRSKKSKSKSSTGSRMSCHAWPMLAFRKNKKLIDVPSFLACTYSTCVSIMKMYWTTYISRAVHVCVWWPAPTNSFGCVLIISWDTRLQLRNISGTQHFILLQWGDWMNIHGVSRCGWSTLLQINATVKILLLTTFNMWDAWPEWTPPQMAMLIAYEEKEPNKNQEFLSQHAIFEINQIAIPPAA